MEKLSLIFFIIIVIYLLYGFIKTRFKKTENKNEKSVLLGEKQVSFQTAEKNETEKAAIAAVIAAIMGDASYVIKRVYEVATVDERNSSWRYAGRNEMMTRKNTLK
jgi:uncharacterized membrane protein